MKQVQDLASQIPSHDTTSFVGQRPGIMRWPPALEVLRLFRPHTNKLVQFLMPWYRPVPSGCLHWHCPAQALPTERDEMASLPKYLRST